MLLCEDCGHSKWCHQSRQTWDGHCAQCFCKKFVFHHEAVWPCKPLKGSGFINLEVMS